MNIDYASIQLLVDIWGVLDNKDGNRQVALSGY